MTEAGLFVHDANGGVSAPVVIAVIAVLLGAWLWHAVADHHLHLWVLRVARPSTAVPATNHDSRWHMLSHPKRLAVNLLLTGTAVLLGLAWELSPYVVAALAFLAAAGAAAWLLIRSANRRTLAGEARDRMSRDARGDKT